MFEIFDEIKEKLAAKKEKAKSKSKSLVEEDEDFEEEEEDEEEEDVGENKAVRELYKKQLEHFILMTSSCKDKIKTWNFEDGKAKMLSSASCIGGNLGGNLTFMMSKAKELCVLSAGNVSNKIELFTM